MNEGQYPALYQSSDSQSQKSQNLFVYSLIANFTCIVLSSIFSTVNALTANFAIIQTIILFIGLSLTVYIAIGKPQQAWYGTRALAESIKTVSWRFMMRAEPYNIEDSEARRHFLVTLRKLFESNKQLSSLSLPVPRTDEITSHMMSIRALPLEERRSYYVTARVDDQRDWYVRKSAFNRKHAHAWLGAIIAVYLILIGFSVARPAYPDTSYWPTDVLLTIAGSLLAWTQTKRYQELTASYALTAHDISLLKAELPTDSSEEKFSSFVGDAENAFSREHTQWQARRDHD
jgi:hypothetical protein